MDRDGGDGRSAVAAGEGVVRGNLRGVEDLGESGGHLCEVATLGQAKGWGEVARPCGEG
jgi:hypothetical protein